MATRGLVLGGLVAALLLAACGSGGGTTLATPAPSLNAFEQELVGTYALEDFFFIQPGEGGFRGEDFAAFAGELRLEPDGTAQIRLELCQEEGAESHGCDRPFLWAADAGWLYLECLDRPGQEAWASWETATMGQLTTEFRVPTNHAECEQLLVEEGIEVFTWTRLD